MYTATTKTILSPIADAISALILINADAEQYNAAMPDLTEVGTVVETQAQNLIQVGQSMLEYGDDQLKAELPLASDEVSQAAKNMVQAAIMLKNDPRSKQGRELLIVAAKGILQGTTKMLDVYDDSEIRKIVNVCNLAKHAIESLMSSVDMQVIKEVIKPCLNLLVELTQMATKRIDELLYPQLQNRLRDAVDNVSKASNLLVSSSKSVLVNPKNEATIQSRNFCCERLIEAIVDIAKIVQIREWSEPAYTDLVGHLSGHRSDIQKQLIGIMTAVQNGDQERLNQLLESFGFTSDVLLQNAEQVGNATAQEAGEELKDLVKSIRPLTQQVASIANQAIISREDAALQKQLYEVLNQALDGFRNIEALTDHVVAANIQHAIAQTKDHDKKFTSLGDFYSMAKAGNLSALNVAKAQLINDGQVLHAALDHASILSPSADVYRQIKNAQDDFGSVLKQVVASGEALASKPSDAILLEHAMNVLGIWEEKLKVAEKVLLTDEAIFDSNDLAASERIAINSLLRKFSKAADSNDKDGMMKAITGISAAIKRLIDLEKRTMERTESEEHRKELLKQISVLNKTFDEVEASSKLIEKDPTQGKQVKNNLLKSQETLNSIVQDFKNAGVKHNFKSELALAKDLIPLPVIEEQKIVEEEAAEPSDGKPVIEVINGEEVEVRNEIAPEPLPEDEAKINPIKAAAQDLKVVTSQYTKSDNVMVNTSSSLAEKLAELSSLYKQNTPHSKKNMINLAKEIHQEASTIFKEAKKIADACKDNVLKKNLMYAMDSIQTIAQQLKIVATVKASEPKDLDSEKQLILCCQNLSAALGRTIKASEAASIRVMRQAGNIALAIVKFRKVLYKKSPTAGKAVPLASIMKVSALSKSK